MKARLVLPVLLAALLALPVAGCGGGDSGGGSGTDPAAAAPSSAPLFAGFTVRPEGAAKTNIESLAKRVAGIDDLGGLIVSELEKSAEDEGESLDFEKEVEPWLGGEGGFFAEKFADEDFTAYGVAFQTEDEDAAWRFVEKQTDREDEPAEDGSYQGVDFKVTADEGQAIGVFDGLLAVAEDEAVFKDMVDASEGEALAEAETFTTATDTLPSESAADVFVDIGALIRESGGAVSPEAKYFLEGAGIEPEGATAVASLVPGSEDVEIDLSSNLAKEASTGGDASKMLGSLPGTSLAAFAGAEFGRRFQEGIDRIDRQGIPGQVPPHQLKKGLKQAGIDLEGIASSIGDVGVFATGNSKRTLGGAVVFETDSAKEATNTISNLGLLLRSTGMAGVTVLGGKLSGFSIRSPELGSQPLVVAAADTRMAIAYGLRAATAALAGTGQTLAESAAYQEALGALGGTPVSGFVDGPAALKLASALMPPGEEGFREAKRYLNKVRYVAVGSAASGDRATAKLIVGVPK